MLSDTIAAIKEVMLMNHKVEQLGQTLEKLADKLDDQNMRLVRIETLVEVSKAQSTLKKLPKK